MVLEGRWDQRRGETHGSTTKPLTITGLENSGGLFVESRQSSPHGVDDALGNTGASGGGGDAADDWDLLDSLVGSGGRADSGGLRIDQLGSADGLDGHGAGFGISIEDKLNLGPLQNCIHVILGLLWAENDSGATSEPDRVGSSNIINLEAI